MQKTVRRVKALVVSRIADLERDLRLECAPFLVSSSSSLSSSSVHRVRSGATIREVEGGVHVAHPEGDVLVRFFNSYYSFFHLFIYLLKNNIK